MNLQRIRRRFEYELNAIGLPGVIGIALTCAALAYGLGSVLPDYEQIDRITASIDKAERRLRAGEVGEPTSRAEQLARFYASFPDGATIPDWLKGIYEAAAAEQLNLDLGTYALVKSQSGRLNQYRIVLPVKGSYPQIRRFIAASLATAPALALEAVTLKKDKIGDAAVDARITFLLYLEKLP